METASRDAYSVASGTMELLLLPTSQAQVPRLPAEVHGREVYRRWNLWVAVCLGARAVGLMVAFFTGLSCLLRCESG